SGGDATAAASASGAAGGEAFRGGSVAVSAAVAAAGFALLPTACAAGSGSELQPVAIAASDSSRVGRYRRYQRPVSIQNAPESCCRPGPDSMPYDAAGTSATVRPQSPRCTRNLGLGTRCPETPSDYRVRCAPRLITRDRRPFGRNPATTDCPWNAR